MYCKQCGFHSFDHLSSCPRCGQDWEATRKALGLQWIEEPRESWIEDQERSDQGDEEPGTVLQPVMEESTLLTEGEDEFALEEDWLLPSEEENTNVSLSEETFVFDEEGHEQVAGKPDATGRGTAESAAEPPIATQALNEKDTQEISDEDLLVPGLEEMLKAKNPSISDRRPSESERNQRDIQGPLSVSLEEDDFSDELLDRPPEASSEGVTDRSEDLGVQESGDPFGSPDQIRAMNGGAPKGRVKNDEDVLEISFEKPRTGADFSPKPAQPDLPGSTHQEIDLEELDIVLDTNRSASDK